MQLTFTDTQIVYKNLIYKFDVDRCHIWSEALLEWCIMISDIITYTLNNTTVMDLVKTLLITTGNILFISK